METKKCNKCGIEKPLTDFSFRKDTNSYRNTCKECINNAHKEYRQNHLQEMREKDRNYYKEHIESRKLEQKEYAQKNKDRIKEYKHNYYESNKQEIYEKHKEYVQKNRNKIRQYQKQYRQENRMKLIQQLKNYYALHKEELQQQNKLYYEENKEDILALQREKYKLNKKRIWRYQQEYKKNNLDKVKESQKKTYLKRRNNSEYIQKKKEYRLANIEKEKKYMKEYHIQHRKEINEYIKKKIENDKVFALKVHVRKTIYNSFTRKNYSKNSESAKILGCDMNTFVEHLLDTYEGNYGEEWNGREEVHIDHIVPLSTATTEAEVLKLCHYTNLQLLKAKDNIQKSDKLDWSIKKKKEE